MIEESRLIEMVRIVGATEPDRIYNNEDERGCTYLPNVRNSCGCIVGEAAVELGVDPALLKIVDDWAPQGISVFWGGEPIADLLSEFFTHDALHSPWVRTVQTYQDQGLSWGNAIRQADIFAKKNNLVML